ncbi:GNAT family N-acetyltransferase [Cellulomonas sp. JZ18]|uniref:GNAT family N-acetyltransferase n=1 Tax=Cellulomonas sp. JZ18 TaxID=2654191 RepID=UPI0012D416B5|nr:GNAT family N-acetyltransferase [Cellulomonas sp. JZ18]QGQ19421.1 GNAT family N-acetyltransferase [Cellulomonas sp. JZ18]
MLPARGRFDDLAAVLGRRRGGPGGCWCTAYRDARVPDGERPAYVRALCDEDPGPGGLAYLDGEVAGWCSVAPRSTYRRLVRSRTIPALDERDPWSLVCVVVLPAFRRRGLVHVLLDGAVEHARTHGVDVVEGYPAETAGTRMDTVSAYVGTVELVEAAGFHRAARTSAHSGGRERWLVRRELTGPVRPG